MNHRDTAMSLRPTLSAVGVQPFAFQTLLIGAAVVLPFLAHVSGAPVRFLLPMHWPVLLAGLVYGWRSGALAGLLAPLTSYCFSGFPLPDVLPSMTLELIAYGFLAGILREGRHNPFLAAAAAVLGGRIVFVVAALVTHTGVTDPMGYFPAALLPGLLAGAGQVILLPLLAEWWISRERRD